MKKAYFTVILTFILSVGFGQNYKDSVLLLNGKVYQCNVVGVEGLSLHLQSPKKDTIEDFYLDSYRVYSYIKDDNETVLYQKNEEIGNFLEADESKRYAIGAYDARHTYKTRFVFWSSFVMSYGVSLWDSYLSPKAFDPILLPDLKAGFFGKSPTMIPFAVPLVLTASFGLPNIRVKEKFMLHKQYQGDKMYYTGFNSYSKQKRAFSALKGSALGIGLGLISYAILKIN